MDIKTLEYMEKRVEEGRKLVREIEHFKKLKEKVILSDEVNFRGHSSEFYVSNHEVVSELQRSFKEIAEKRIEKLEVKLARL